MSDSTRTPLAELTALFLKLGTTAFGGPAAHIAMMEEEVVRRRNWLSHEEFLDLLGATNFIPGPNSTEMAIHIGYRRAGLPGLLVAGSCFILPAALIVTAIAYVYVHFGTLPQAVQILAAVKPVVIAVILQALWRLGPSAVKSWLLGIAGIAAALVNALGANELLVLFVTASLVAAIETRAWRARSRSTLLAWGLPLIPTTQVIVSISLASIFLSFLKIGAVLFGSGYVLIAFLRADFVQRLHWLSEAQLLDAVAVGQVTPGPVFTTATFIGYILSGPKGAAVATLGIFLPAFVFVALSAPLIPMLRKSRIAGAFLDGLNVASLALMAVVTVQLAHSALVDAWTIGLALLSAILLIGFRINSTWLVLGAAGVGLLRWLL